MRCRAARLHPAEDLLSAEATLDDECNDKQRGYNEVRNADRLSFLSERPTPQKQTDDQHA